MKVPGYCNYGGGGFGFGAFGNGPTPDFSTGVTVVIRNKLIEEMADAFDVAVEFGTGTNAWEAVEIFANEFQSKLAKLGDTSSYRFDASVGLQIFTVHIQGERVRVRPKNGAI